MKDHYQVQKEERQPEANNNSSKSLNYFEGGGAPVIAGREDLGEYQENEKDYYEDFANVLCCHCFFLWLWGLV